MYIHKMIYICLINGGESNFDIKMFSYILVSPIKVWYMGLSVNITDIWMRNHGNRWRLFGRISLIMITTGLLEESWNHFGISTIFLPLMLYAVSREILKRYFVNWTFLILLLVGFLQIDYIKKSPCSETLLILDLESL